MGERFYLDLEPLVPLCSVEELHRGVIQLLHGMNTNAPAQRRIALAFPGWQHHPGHPQHTTLGRTLRLVGERLSLVLFSRHPIISRMEEGGELRVLPVRPVPEDAAEVRFVRDRRRESRMRRFGKEAAELPTYPWIRFQSESNRRTFSLSVRMEGADRAVTTQYGTYGLSLEGSTVPMF
ncbi:hypothetical protein J2T57_001206 [Natronocella acetinitrilica]|uniref:Uncharacterized protein n=1 Tax=Natronocella acetinitrilica TaxID=414046 RepID=A0AAE3KAX1_9GAMM|nr:type I-F CRISPR-associated endoribonuclease Cas6/Csy4 [Natronocella acetinitrilica]MCP1674104.1 hypothetical protein [Natronocella acetinitrilica]